MPSAPSGGAQINEVDVCLQPRPDDRPFYTCGDRVRGVVVLRNPMLASGVEASIKFIGTVRTKIGPRINIHQPSYSSEATLFQFTQYLSVGHKSQRGAAQIWPFDFSFPSSAQSTSQTLRFTRDAKFSKDPGHALPPSFRGASRSREWDSNAVTYTLEATISKPYFSHPFPRGINKFSRDLPFCQSRDSEHYTLASGFVTKPVTLSDLQVPNVRQTVTEQLYEPTQKLVTVLMEAPTAIPAGKQLPLHVGLIQEAPELNPHSTPFLQSVDLILISLSHVRTQSTYFGLGQEPYESWSESWTLADSGAIHIPLSERWDVRDLVKDIKVPLDMVPNFKTYNIARSYKLNMKAVISTEDHRCRIPLELEQDITILPAMSRADCVQIGTDRPATQQTPASNLTSSPELPVLLSQSQWLQRSEFTATHRRWSSAPTPWLGAASGRGRHVRRSFSQDEEPPPPYEEHEGAARLASAGSARASGSILRLPSFETAAMAQISGT